MTRKTSRNSRLVTALCVWAGVASASANCFGSAFVRGAYYRLGDDDPGAAPGAMGNPLTRDSLGDDEPLARYGLPRYSADVPLRGPAGNKLSVQFVNEEQLLGPFPGAYGRSESLPMSEPGYALEAWVKAALTPRDALRNGLVAYNGDPTIGNGFGFFLRGENYVFRAGTAERVLGPAAEGQWRHLAYVQSMGTSSYYYDGQLVAESSTDALPVAASGGFHLAGLLKGQLIDTLPFPFDGWIDEVRYQTFNPIAAGAFEPTNFLVGPVPEPAAVSLVAGVALLALRRHRRR